ncbi:hypothetical protein [Candidatus Nitrospira allomarina]|uniref:Uncharacterized protein n=1 Tax=Candidatus Nitrospira allomarina TaxID=3020900 RepID=A0AA96GE54_9BACT|nr:hypothetical protein [Candidatus Nitrospira allomarina]WNM57228.1 hypothetical protein PP769_14765 [Candidatus Nitrospira allomarina]
MLNQEAGACRVNQHQPKDNRERGDGDLQPVVKPTYGEHEYECDLV